MGSNLIKSYTELITLPTFEERFNYLRQAGRIGEDTFGPDRYIYQAFLASLEWKRFRRQVLIRDNACEMGLIDEPIPDGVIIVVHHINPITVSDVINRSPLLFDMDNVISMSQNLHRFLHYGGGLPDCMLNPIERVPNDTCPWKN